MALALRLCSGPLTWAAYSGAIEHEGSGESLVLTATAVATGGEALARDSDGRVVLVEGALPGEQVRAVVTRAHRTYARARVVDVLAASPHRVAPPCPHVARGCGGCGWQHVQPEAQARLKADVVADNLRRLGRLLAPTVRVGPGVGPRGYRATVRLAVVDGGVGFRRRRGHEVVVVDECLVAHPLLADLIGAPRATFGTAGEVTLRCGTRTGQRLALLAPSSSGARFPGDVTVVGADELAAGRQAWFHEEVAGRRLRISAQSFFQSSAEGAELLVGLVAQALAGAPDGPLVDAYGGVGLFGATVGGGRRLTIVETSRSSLADARANLPGAAMVAGDVAQWRAQPAAAVVADPPRAGLGGDAAAVLAATGASHLALVSCDPASLGRDAGLLGQHGFDHEWSTVADLFPGTPHVEVVSRFVRTDLGYGRGAAGGRRPLHGRKTPC